MHSKFLLIQFLAVATAEVFLVTDHTMLEHWKLVWRGSEIFL
jgi:hypothetical protein